MHQHLDAAIAASLFAQYTGWFGPPRVLFEGKTIDGRTREQVWPFSAAALRPLTRYASTASEATRYLVLAGHYDRARAFVPDVLTHVDDVAAFCGLAREQVAPMCVKQRPPPMRARTTMARRRVIEAIARAIREGEQDGSGQVSCERLRQLLHQWLPQQ